MSEKYIERPWRERLWEQVNPFETLIEEIANAITHGIGALLATAGLTLMVLFAAQNGADPWRIVSASIYGGSLVLLYIASTLFHSFQFPPIKRMFLIMDHVGIFLLIAGTYTPILLVKLRNPVGWTFFAVIWTLAIVGAFVKAFFTERFNRLTVLCYVAMGWMSLFLLGYIAEALGAGGITLIVAGGISYTLGVIPYWWRSLPFNHAIWHLFVIGGSVCHYLAIYLYVLPMT